MRDASFVPARVLWLVLGVLSAVSMGFYVTRIWSANQPSYFNDLYAPWYGSSELFHRRNPYTPAVAHQIQSVIYGAPVEPSLEDPSGLGGGFAYPPFTAILLWPALYLSFPAAQKLFLFAAVPVLLLTLALWLRALQFRPSPLQWLALALFILGNFPALQAMKLQNLSLVAAAFVALTGFLLATDRFVPAGVALALSAFKPQFMLALIPWLAIWVLSDWRRRRGIAGGFLTTMLALILASEWLVPGSLRAFFRIARAYRHYTYGHSLLDVWFSPALGSWIGAALLLAVFAICWRYRTEQTRSPMFFQVVSLLLSVTLIVIPTLAPHAQLLLLPGFLCLLRDRSFIRSSRRGAAFVVAAWAVLSWQWIAAFGLMSAAALRIPTSTLVRFWQIPLFTSPLVPLAVLIPLGYLIIAHRGSIQVEGMGIERLTQL